jgi:hypothetical protein
MVARSFRGARRTLRLFAFALPLAALLAAGVPARADGPADAEAVAFFDQGRKLMADGKYAEASLRFEESVRHGRTVGALLNLGRCYEELGRAASAWASYRAAESLARELRDARETDASRFAEAVRGKASTVAIDDRATVGIAGLRVARDGVEIGAAARGEAVPVDPGDHVVEASAPGRASFREVVHVGALHEADVVRVPPLPQVAQVPSEGSVPEKSGARAPSPGVRPLAIASFAVGGVGLALGTMAGLVAIAKHEQATSACASYPNHCPASGDADGPNNDSRTWAAISTVGLAVGGAALATGFVLVLTAPRGDSARAATITPLVGTTGGGLCIRASF